MKVLVLSCSTGGGHNACGHYIEKEFRENNVICDFIDYFDILGPKAKERVEKLYLSSTKYNGNIFKLVYKLGEVYSKTGISSPVYSLNKLGKNKLYSYIKENNYDLIISPHLFPAMAVTTLKKEGKNIKLINVATDYHVIPFWEETNPDYFVIPHSTLKNNFIKKGFKEEILLDFGISVSSSFNRIENNLNLLADRDVVLITSGSMGFGKMKEIVKSLLNNIPNIYIVAIPGVENYNAKFFHKNGLSLVSNNVEEVKMNTVKLLKDKNMQERIIENQSKIINRNSAKDLVNFVLRKSKIGVK